jgi:O-antigen ligase
LIFWSVITIPMSYWPGGSLHLLTDQYLKAIAFFWLLATIITTPERVRALFWSLTLCAIPLAATGIWHYLSGDVMKTTQDGLVRVVGYQGSSGLTGNPNDLALMLNLIIPLTGALALSSHGMKRLFAVGVTLLSMAGVVITFSRAGFLALAATFFMFLLVLVRRKSGGAAMALLVVALAVPFALPHTYVERLSTITNLDQDKTGSAQGRYKDLGIALEVVSHNPVVGVGLGQDMIALNQARGLATWRSVHNVYLQYAVDLGLPDSRCLRGCICSASAVRGRWNAGHGESRPPPASNRWPPASRSRSLPFSSRRCFTRSPTSSISSASPASRWR